MPSSVVSPPFWVDILSGAKKDLTKPKNRTDSTKEFSEQFEGATGSLPSKTRVLRQITPESSPERSAKSLSHNFFVVSLKRAQRLTFWARRLPGGVGAFHAKGWGSKVRALLQKSVSLKFEGGNLRCPGNLAGMSRTYGGVQKVCVNSVHTRGIVKTSGFTRGVCKNQGFY